MGYTDEELRARYDKAWASMDAARTNFERGLVSGIIQTLGWLLGENAADPGTVLPPVVSAQEGKDGP